MTNPHRPRIIHSRHRGFVIIIAIVLLGLAGATLAVMATLFAGEAKRTQALGAEVQIRELLIAGEAAARSRLDSNHPTTQPITIELPPQLQVASVTISGDAASTQIVAQYQNRRAAQTISYTKDGNSWRIANVKLHTP